MENQNPFTFVADLPIRKANVIQLVGRRMGKPFFFGNE